MIDAEIINYARECFDRIDVQLDGIEAGIAELKGGVTALELGVAQLYGDFARQSLRIDRMEVRLDRIERRMGPAETYPAAVMTCRGGIYRHALSSGRGAGMVQRIAGKLLEAHFGPGVMPETAFRDADDLYRRMASLGSKPSGFSFGSVRMQQGEVYKRRPGALVVEIDATARGVGPSGNDFDQYDAAWWI